MAKRQGKTKPTGEPTMWAITDKGRLVECPAGPPVGATYFVREGDAQWTPADAPPAVADAPAPAVSITFDFDGEAA